MSVVEFSDGQKIYYQLTRKRVKNINFRVAEDGHINVSASPRVSEEYIIKYIVDHKEEFLSAIDRALSRKISRRVDCASVRWLGKEYRVEYIDDDCDEHVELYCDVLYVYTQSLDEAARLALIHQWRVNEFMQLCSELNDEVRSRLISDGKVPPHTTITIKDLKSRWGSCSYRSGRISLNYQLAAYPRETILGVLWHEYTHYWHHDHQKGFYSQLLYYYPEYYKWDSLLK